jgi:aspartate/methionine/tyrosine aminotransferase
MNGAANIRDEAFVYQLIYENGIASIPCCCFQSEDNPMRDKYVRFTFCKNK